MIPHHGYTLVSMDCTLVPSFIELTQFLMDFFQILDYESYYDA